MNYTNKVSVLFIIICTVVIVYIKLGYDIDKEAISIHKNIKITKNCLSGIIIVDKNITLIFKIEGNYNQLADISGGSRNYNVVYTSDIYWSINSLKCIEENIK